MSATSPTWKEKTNCRIMHWLVHARFQKHRQKGKKTFIY